MTSGSAALGYKLDPDQMDKFRRYCHVLLATNRELNLTAVRDAEGVMRTLFLDSLTIGAAVRSVWKEGFDGRAVRLVDVGSGAGIPGIPLKIVHPDWSLLVVESVGKKARFIQSAVEQIGLGDDVTVVAERAETAGRDPRHRDRADLCTARAVAALPTLLELCAPFVRRQGFLALPKSGDIGPEIRAAEPAALTLGLALERTWHVDSEFGLGEGRKVLIYRKIGPTPPDYPRRVGMAKIRPIRER